MVPSRLAGRHSWPFLMIMMATLRTFGNAAPLHHDLHPPFQIHHFSLAQLLVRNMLTSTVHTVCYTTMQVSGKY